MHPHYSDRPPWLTATVSEAPRGPNAISLNLFYRRRPRRSKTNCRSIEIPLFIPLSELQDVTTLPECIETEMGIVEAMADTQVEDITSRDKNNFPFLDLPFEIRLAIYEYLLPTRNHTIVTQYPHNGYYYSKPPSHTTQTLYPAWSASPHSPPSHNATASHILTTYKLLNANFRKDFPSPSICTAIFRSCKQVLKEAEPVLYAGAMFDFGVYVDAVVPFLNDRSAVARKHIRSLKLAREIPQSVTVSSMQEVEGNRQVLRDEKAEMDPLWSKTCEFLRNDCSGLRTVDLTVWAESGNMFELPMESPSQEMTEADGSGAEEQLEPTLVDDGHLWRQWEWTRKLLECEGLRHVKVTWWGFAMDKVGQGRFDSWLGRRMVADKMVRDRMIWEGCVVEGVCVVPGGWKASSTIGS